MWIKRFADFKLRFVSHVFVKEPAQGLEGVGGEPPDRPADMVTVQEQRIQNQNLQHRTKLIFPAGSLMHKNCSDLLYKKKSEQNA